jgi:probable F420-dependent oxidoreductase
LLMPDHFEPDRMSTFLSLLMAAEATKHVRIGTFVIDNDFRHPALLAQEAATLDLLSDGRLELGIGAGYAEYDYAATGIPLDPPGVRVSRLAESVQIIKRLLAGETVTFSGDYYTTHELMGRPQALQQPHPPLLIGGGGKRLLSLAAREADIISLVPKAKPGALEFNDSSHAATEQKIAWIRDAAGERMAALELNTLVFECIVTDQRQRVAEEVAQKRGAPVEHVLNSVHFLIGTVEQITEEV